MNEHSTVAKLIILWRGLRERFDIIVADRPCEVPIWPRVGTYGPHFGAFLKEVDCLIDTILGYLFEASEGLDGLLSRSASFSNDHRPASKKNTLVASP